MSDMNLDKLVCPTSLLFYEACIKGKQHRAMFPIKGGGGRRATKPLEIIHFDVYDLIKTTSMAVECIW